MIGIGGLGHMAVQILKATTAARVIAVDSRPEALEVATAHGADLTLLSGEQTAAEIRKATGGRGADAIFDCVGNDRTISTGLAAGRMMGDFTIIGIGGGTAPVGFFSVPYEYSVQTTYWGSRPELVEVLDLAARGLIRAATTVFSLDDAVEAYHRLEKGQLTGRAVIVP